ncbi:MAG: phage terminase large subunit [Acidocella sp.]|nr:phage terminase large subunit [Acidocella sp.]
MSDEPDFLTFARYAMAAIGQAPARHHEVLIQRLQEVANGTCDRLMVQMPPGSAKSTYGSVLFPAYFLSRHSRAQVIASAHTASLARHFGRAVRTAIVEHGGYLGIDFAPVSKGNTAFYTKGGGEYFASGVRGPITGRRADLIIIDDPVKSCAEAESEVARAALFEWYRAELSARLKPGGRIVLIMTRWHQDDLAGRLMRGGEPWTCLRLPALAEANDSLGRRQGEALWPEWQDLAAIERLRTQIGERTFASMYQQAPIPPGDGMLHVSSLNIVKVAPDLLRELRGWDLAASAPVAGRNPDYTVGVKIGLTASGEIIICDVIRFRAAPGEVEARIQAAARADGVRTVIALPRDPGQVGLAQIAMLSRGLAEYQIMSSPEQGAKTVRALPVATQIDAGMVKLVEAAWNQEFLDELALFPHGSKDDQVDALSRAVNTLLTSSSNPARRVNVPLLAR